MSSSRGPNISPVATAVIVGDEGPSLPVVGTIVKSSVDMPTGIALVGTGKVRISQIHPGSLFSYTKLRPGMIIVSVNNTKSTSKEHAAKMIREACGIVSVLALPRHLTVSNRQLDSLMTVSITKERETDPAGLSLRQTMLGTVYISRIDDNSPFSLSDLRSGMHIVSINNVKPLTLRQAFSLIRQSPSVVTILAERLLTSSQPTAIEASSSDQILEIPAAEVVLPEMAEAVLAESSMEFHMLAGERLVTTTSTTAY